MSDRFPPRSPDVAAVKAIRHFNRFYTRRIGVLDPYLGSELSLTDVRVLYELAHREAPVASEIGKDLHLDGGYLSRILRRFEAQGWLRARARRARRAAKPAAPDRGGPRGLRAAAAEVARRGRRPARTAARRAAPAS